MFPYVIGQWLLFLVGFLQRYWYEKECFVAVCRLVVVSCHYCVVETDGKKIIVVVADLMAVVVAFGQMIDIADSEDYDRDWCYLVV